MEYHGHAAGQAGAGVLSSTSIDLSLHRPPLPTRDGWRLQQHAGPSSYDTASGFEEEMWGVMAESQENMEGPYPERPGEPDCAYYVRTGLCGYGMRCRFNHPSNRRLASAASQGRGEYPERMGHPECPHYLKTGTCKFGSSCKYHHPREKAGSLGRAQLNAVNLPLRPGEKECAYYMRTGDCKYGVTCKFNHPQPRAMVGTVLSMPGSPLFPGGSAHAAPAHQAFHPPSFQPWPTPARGPFFPTSRIQSPSTFAPLLLPSPQGLVPIPAWSTFQGAISSPDRQQQPLGGPYVYGAPSPQQDVGLHGGVFSPYMTGGSGSRMRVVVPSQSAMGSRDWTYPERPGQPECQYYMKTGECRFGSSCKFHHPKDRSASQATPFLFSPIGLPLRPGAPQCGFYSRNGFCRFGATCKYDHPFLGLPFTPSAAAVDVAFPAPPSSALTLALPSTARERSNSGTSHRQSKEEEKMDITLADQMEQQSVPMQSSAATASITSES